MRHHRNSQARSDDCSALEQAAVVSFRPEAYPFHKARVVRYLVRLCNISALLSAPMPLQEEGPQRQCCGHHEGDQNSADI